MATTARNPLFDRHADVALEGLLPSQVGGATLEKFSVSGDELITPGSQAQFDDFLGRLGKSTSDLAMATAADPTKVVDGSISAMRVTGADPGALLDAFLAVQGARENPPLLENVVLGGRNVTRVSFGGAGLIQYVHASGDVLFIVAAPNETTAGQFLEALA